MSKKTKQKPVKKTNTLKRGPGRPPKDDSERLMVVGTRVPPKIFKRLQKKADSQSMSVSNLLRDICYTAVGRRAA